jgi:hypothetical protein
MFACLGDEARCAALFGNGGLVSTLFPHVRWDKQESGFGLFNAFWDLLPKSFFLVTPSRRFLLLFLSFFLRFSQHWGVLLVGGMFSYICFAWGFPLCLSTARLVPGDEGIGGQKTLTFLLVCVCPCVRAPLFPS